MKGLVVIIVVWKLKDIRASVHPQVGYNGPKVLRRSEDDNGSTDEFGSTLKKTHRQLAKITT
jgi:hypothetical protein